MSCLVFRASFPSSNPLGPFTALSTILLSQLWLATVISLVHFKALFTSCKTLRQSISSHYRPICSPALCWTILLLGLSFFHALSHFPAQFSFVNSLIFIFPIPWSLHSTVGSPCLPHSSIHWEKPHHIHSQPFSWWINPNTPQGAWSGPQEGCITHCICVFSQMVRILVLSD